MKDPRACLPDTISSNTKRVLRLQHPNPTTAPQVNALGPIEVLQWKWHYISGKYDGDVSVTPPPFYFFNIETNLVLPWTPFHWNARSLSGKRCLVLRMCSALDYPMRVAVVRYCEFSCLLTWLQVTKDPITIQWARWVYEQVLVTQYKLITKMY